MLVPWHLAAKFGIVWAVGGLLMFVYSMASGEFSGLGGSAGASSQLVDASLDPTGVVLNDPSLGEGAGDLSLTLSFLNTAKDWTVFAIRALALQYDFLATNVWVSTGRWIILAFAAPFGLNLGLIGAQFMAQMIRGLTRIPIPFLGRGI